MEASSGLSKLLGGHLLNQKHEQVPLSEVVKDKKYVGLYFSASKSQACVFESSDKFSWIQNIDVF